MNTQPEYYSRLAAAFVRGKLAHSAASRALDLFEKPLDELNEDELLTLIQLGGEAGLRLHRFKRTMDLPRVRKVLGILKGLQPRDLLDIGSGRGAFLWPLLDSLPELPVMAVDTLAYRVADIQTVREGGISWLEAREASATALPFSDRTFEVVTMLEVLEHIPETRRALAEVCRVASRFVVISVPSKEDDNPEHIHLFNQQRLTQLLQEQGMTRVSFEYVLNHLVVVARIETR